MFLGYFDPKDSIVQVETLKSLIIPPFLVTFSICWYVLVSLLV